MPPPDFSRALCLSLAVLLLASACGDDGTPANGGNSSPPTETPDPGPAPTVTPEPPPMADFEVRGSVEQAYLVGAEAGMELTLIDAEDAAVATGTVDDNGTLIYRDLTAGLYRVETPDGTSSQAFEVKTPDDVPPQSFYASQEIGPGYGYLETRDGTLLAYNAILPGPPEGGPYPTLIEYSGYDPATRTRRSRAHSSRQCSGMRSSG